MTETVRNFHGKIKSFLNKRANIYVLAAILVLALYISTKQMSSQLINLYHQHESALVQDRNGTEIAILPNAKGAYMRKISAVPPEFARLLIQKEDTYFYHHPGINVGSMLRSVVHYPFSGRLQGSSTLTQQLVKNLLSNENKRTVRNKIMEILHALSLELYTSKQDILVMYVNTAYFGNQAQGLTEAARVYFHTSPESLSSAEYAKLLAPLSNPSRYPTTEVYQRTHENMFELAEFAHACTKPCTLTVDNILTEKLRDILQANLADATLESVLNGAIVVIRLGKNTEHNQLLAVIGSPYPRISQHGYQINMAVQPRPIGSTAKPFIYAKAFEKGARPYTQVDDREYKYKIGTGFELYPRNYDGTYRGIVTLHQALANSLNVPSVQVLEYAGLHNFYAFLEKDLGFKPLRPLNSYELGIALGALDMDLLTLIHYFTIFPNQGVLKPLDIGTSVAITPPLSLPISDERQVLDPAFTELVTQILSDRLASVDEFGVASSLNLSASNYAVKTGTSHDYHDSWTIGYTPDFLVGVWLGNSDNKPMHKLSGQMGAGKVWHDVMEVLLNSEYNSRVPFQLTHVQSYPTGGTIEYGLAGDNYEQARDLLLKQELIAEPHDSDVFEFEPRMVIPLQTTNAQTASWFINGSPIGENQRVSWKPTKEGAYEIEARTNEKKQQIKVFINLPE